MADKPVANNPANATPAASPTDTKEKPVAAQATPPAAAKTAVTPPPAKEGGQTVPLPELMEERGKRQALEQTIQQMQSELEALKKVAPAPQQQPQNQQYEQYQKQMDELWESDPRKAVQAEIMTAMNWYDNVQAQLDGQEHSLATKYPDFNNYRNEIRGYVRSLPIDQRQRPGIIELAYYAVKGQRVDTTMEDMKKQWEAEFLRKLQSGEMANTPAGTVSAPPIVPGTPATDEERKVAEMMGMSVDDYLRNKRGA